MKELTFSELLEFVCQYCDDKTKWETTCRVCRLRQFVRLLELIFLKHMEPEKAAKMAQHENLYGKPDEDGDEERYRIAV